MDGTLLHEAARNGSTGIGSYLIDMGADIEAKNEVGCDDWYGCCVSGWGLGLMICAGFETR